MQTVLIVIHLLIAIALIGVILLQRSEGGALGIGGGSGGGGNLFSARGVGNALTRTTAYLAIAFFITSIALTVISTRKGTAPSAFDGAPAQTQPPGEGNSGAQAPVPAPGGQGTGGQGTGGSVLPQLPASPQVPVSP